MDIVSCPLIRELVQAWRTVEEELDEEAKIVSCPRFLHRILQRIEQRADAALQR